MWTSHHLVENWKHRAGHPSYCHRLDTVGRGSAAATIRRIPEATYNRSWTKPFPDCPITSKKDETGRGQLFDHEPWGRQNQPRAYTITGEWRGLNPACLLIGPLWIPIPGWPLVSEHWSSSKYDAGTANYFDPRRELCVSTELCVIRGFSVFSWNV